MPAQTVIKIRRDTSTNWESVNPTLAAGEIAFETDTNKIKVGDGSSVWASLDYASGAGTAAEITYDNVDAELIATTVKGALDELSLTKADVSQLSTNLAVFATTAASDISGYNVLVSSVDNPDYNDTAVDVATGAINADDQLIASLAASAGLFEGQVDPITVTTIGNIRKTAGNNNQSASFYFEVYVRNSGGTETLVGTSDTTGEINPSNSDYEEFSASALVTFGTVTATDRIVVKYYGNVVDGAGAEYDFQFGGSNPTRTLIPVPASVIVVHEADAVTVDTTNFDGVLSGSDTTVQAALETLDDLDISAGVITSDTPPNAPENGDLWWESDTGILYIYYDNFWVEAVSGIVGPQGESGAVISDTEPADQDVLWVDTSSSATAESTLNNGTQGLTAVSNGSSGLSYQPVSHNYVINGAFDIWQRGDGPFTDPAFLEYTSDRWHLQRTGPAPVSFSISQEEFSTNELSVPAFGNADKYMRLTLTTPDPSTAYIAIGQRVEDVRTLAGQEVTLSFYAKSNAVRTDRIHVRQFLYSGGRTKIVVADENFTNTTTWQRFSFTFLNDDLPKTAIDGDFLEVRIGTQDMTQGNEIDIWGVQLEAGSIATPFKRNANSIAGEELVCRRYYKRVDITDAGGAGYKTSPTSNANLMFNAAGSHNPPMRTNSPDASVVTAGNFQGCTFDSLNTDGDFWVHRVDVTAGGVYRAFGEIIQFEDEL